MKNVRSGSGFAVFMIFFGAALLDALQSGSGLRAVFWLATGAIFLAADVRRPRENT